MRGVRADAEGERVVSGQRYYLLCAVHGYVGNAVLWWRARHQGYTTDLEDAGIYDAEEALAIEARGEGTSAVPVEEARAAARTYVHGDTVSAHVTRARRAMDERERAARKALGHRHVPQTCAHPGCGRFVTNKRSPDERCDAHRWAL